MHPQSWTRESNRDMARKNGAAIREQDSSPPRSGKRTGGAKLTMASTQSRRRCLVVRATRVGLQDRNGLETHRNEFQVRRTSNIVNPRCRISASARIEAHPRKRDSSRKGQRRRCSDAENRQGRKRASQSRSRPQPPRSPSAGEPTRQRAPKHPRSAPP